MPTKPATRTKYLTLAEIAAAERACKETRELAPVPHYVIATRVLNGPRYFVTFDSKYKAFIPHPIEALFCSLSQAHALIRRMQVFDHILFRNAVVLPRWQPQYN